MNRKYFKFLLSALFLLFIMAFLSLGGGHPNYTQINARGATRPMVVLERALENFFRDVKRYPSTEEGLNALILKPKNSMGWKGPYVTKKDLESRYFQGNILKDVWGTDYVYISPSQYGKRLPYNLYSCGQNKTDDFGEKDDITNWKDVNWSYYNDERTLHEADPLLKWSSVLVVVIPFLIVLLLVFDHDYFMKTKPKSAQRVKESYFSRSKIF